MFDIFHHRSDLSDLCKSLHINRLYVFGSSLTESFNEKSSDLDFLVEINQSDPLERGELLLEFWEKLEVMFDRKIDLLTPESIKNPVLLEQINSTKKIIYDREGEKIPD